MACFIEPHTFHVTLTPRIFKFENENELPAMPVVFSVSRMSRMAAFETFRFVDLDTNEVLARTVMPWVDESEEEEDNEDEERGVYRRLLHSTTELEEYDLISKHWNKYLESLKTEQDVKQTKTMEDDGVEEHGGDMESEKEKGKAEKKEKSRPGFLQYLRCLEPPFRFLELLIQKMEDDQANKADRAKAKMAEIEKAAAAAVVGCVFPGNKQAERPKPRYFYVNLNATPSTSNLEITMSITLNRPSDRQTRRARKGWKLSTQTSPAEWIKHTSVVASLPMASFRPSSPMLSIWH